MDLRGAPEAIHQREMIDRAMARLNSCIPGMIESFDSAKQRATVRPGIKMKITQESTISYIDMPRIINVPVMFPFAGGFGCTLPVKAGDPCLLLFSQRNIDNWLQSGGIQPPEQDVIGARHHDLTDAIAIMGIAPDPDVFGNWNSSGIELRNKIGTSKVTVQDDKIQITWGAVTLVVSALGVQIVGNVLITGNLQLTGTLKDSSITYGTHTHTDPQGGSTGGPA